MSRLRSRASTLIAVLAGCGGDYVHVLVEGSDLELTVAPVEIQVAVRGGGRGTAFQYVGSFDPPRGEEANLPYTDFVVTFEDAPREVDLVIAVPTTTTKWGGDARAVPPGDGARVHIPLSAGEKAIADMRLVDGDLTSAALFGPGVVMAWPDALGVAVRVERDPDRPQARTELVASDPNASKVRVASRPGATGFGPDFYALVWRGGDRQVRLRSFTQVEDFPARTLGSGDDVGLACARTGQAFQVVTARLDGSDVWVGLHALDGSPLGPAAHVLDGVTAIAGLVSAPGSSYVLAIRSQSGSRLVRFDHGGGILGDVPVPGDLRALALSADGNRLLVALVEDDELKLAPYFAGNLAGTAAPVTVAAWPAKLADDAQLSRVSLSDCAVVWPEPRTDGSEAVDLRFQYLDADGVPIGVPHLAAADGNGDHFAPSAVCASETRAYMTFLQRASAGTFMGGLRLRRVPSRP